MELNTGKTSLLCTKNTDKYMQGYIMSKGKVLIVDDDEVCRLYFRDCFQRKDIA